WGSSVLRGWWADTQMEGGTADGTASFSTQLDLRPTPLWSLTAGHTSIGREFRPALGFVRRRDMVRSRVGASLVPRFDGSTWARQLVLATTWNYYEGQDGAKQSVDGLLHSMLIFQSGDNVSITVNHDLDV